MTSTTTTYPPERFTSFIDWIEYVKEELKQLTEQLNK